MDPALKEAATTGDVDFLKEAFSKQPSEYFLTQDEGVGGNIFHLASWNDKEEFIKEAMNILPKEILKQLLFQVDDDYMTPLHVAAVKGDCNYNIVMLMKGVYESLALSYEDDDGLVKPWLAMTEKNMTALHQALKYEDENNENEKCAIEILLMDPEFESCTIVDDYDNTPLFYALKNGFNGVSEMILMSPLASSAPSFIFCSEDSWTPFEYSSVCSEVVLRLLFKRYGDWLDKVDDKGFSILHQWAEDGEAKPCKLLLEGGDFGEVRTKIFIHMVSKKEKTASDTPMHIAASKKDSELAQILIRGYQQVSASMGENQEVVAEECPPWTVKNIYGNTPLHTALSTTSKHFELALEILSIDPTMCKLGNNKGESPFFLAVMSGCDRVVDAIMNIEELRFQMLRCNDGTTVIHGLSSCSEKIGTQLLQKYWWLINLRDDSGKSALDYAKQSHTLWLVKLLEHPSLIQKENFDWIEACKRGETGAVLAFVDTCQDLQQICRIKNDTPLHHIRLSTYKHYFHFLKKPSIAEIKNFTDHDGATALHRALERKDMLLAKILLLDDEVERNIPDNYGRTSVDLLDKLCNENNDWEKMCKLIKISVYLKMSYIPLGTNLDPIRSTLSVVAALLATITFAAGFTLPGGLNSDSGEAILARKVGFLIFLLADVYAMCTSILVLFCLIWSMVSEPDIARLLVDRSVIVLMHSLYGTLVAFMAGIYTVINQRSLWAAIVISVMCSIIGILANRTVLLRVIVMLVPAVESRRKSRLLEKESKGASSSENITTIKVE